MIDTEVSYWAMDHRGVGHPLRKFLEVSGRWVMWCGLASELDDDAIKDVEPGQTCPSCAAELRNASIGESELTKARLILAVRQR